MRQIDFICCNVSFFNGVFVSFFMIIDTGQIK